MKSFLMALVAVVAVGSAYCMPFGRVAACHVSLRLIDDATGKLVGGVIRIRGGDGTVLTPPGLASRGWGLAQSSPMQQWYVLPGATTIELPQATLTFEAISGIETEQVRRPLDLTSRESHELAIRLPRFSHLRQQGWFAANTHLHLSRLTRSQAEQYLREFPVADALDLLFISYLERAEDDRGYITNVFPIGRLRELETGGVLVANGEEHRHNFGPQGEGYGHVMLLGIKRLVQPVSIGAGISKKPPDAPAIRAGIDAAREQGGTAIWCHNNWGFEDVPNWLAGRLDAQNIFDGGSHGGYAESFYHYLNAGLRVPFSTGTDWYMYDFARCYARLSGELTPESWLAALKSGRTFISNGPLLDLAVEGRGPGDTIALDAAGKDLSIRATAKGRVDFGRLELVQNGDVVESAPARAVGGHFEARLELRRVVMDPAWLAVRITSENQSEYGAALFAHSSAIYVTVGGRSVRLVQDVEFLRRELQSARSTIAAKGQFDDAAQRARILKLYDDAIASLQ